MRGRRPSIWPSTGCGWRAGGGDLDAESGGRHHSQPSFCFVFFFFTNEVAALSQARLQSKTRADRRRIAVYHRRIEGGIRLMGRYLPPQFSVCDKLVLRVQHLGAKGSSLRQDLWFIP